MTVAFLTIYRFNALEPVAPTSIKANRSLNA
jgi:hypothetical protein